jgi:selenocysteine lyase/cysteine desulfurase
MTDTDAVTRLLKAHGALAIWDYAAGAPYLDMAMGEGAAAKDAIVFSPHKFPGGPGATGILVLRDPLVLRDRPTAPGGGSVSFVSPWRHAYSRRVEAREEAGTPNVIGDIRAALAMLVKDAVGAKFIAAREAELRQRALAAWNGVREIELLGQRPHVDALPIFSFRIRQADGSLLHHQLFTRMLSDHYGIQARGGCACAGPYAHRLLGLDETASDALFARIEAGEEWEKPGWVRLNLSYLHGEEQVVRILESVVELARKAPAMEHLYRIDPRTARFSPVQAAAA